MWYLRDEAFNGGPQMDETTHRGLHGGLPFLLSLCLSLCIALCLALCLGPLLVCRLTVICKRVKVRRNDGEHSEY